MNCVTRRLVLATIAASLIGCSTTGPATEPSGDPLEGFNRAMFNFNDKVDQAALKPAATAYRDHLPEFVQIAVGNFFGNIGDVWTAANQFLQGKVADGLSDGMRVAVNTFLGFGGVLDIASEAGLPKHKQDFGVTLGVWGVPSGPYVVLPLLGPSTVRDTSALPVDMHGDLWTTVTPVHWRNTGSVARVVDQRASLLNASNLLEDAALDRYEFVRDAYLQRRAGKIEESASTSSAPAPARDIEPPTDPAPARVPPGAAKENASAEPLTAAPLQLDVVEKKTMAPESEPIPLQAAAESDALPASDQHLSSSAVPQELTYRGGEPL
jgi:phospholipid-binding lipoprotein MlaA